MVLHITNGSRLKEYLLAGGFPAKEEKMISFNESMITGESPPELFTEAFFCARATALRVTQKEYQAVVQTELYELLKTTHDQIILWFDADMFCQINALTICAYLDYVQFTGTVQLNIIPQMFWQYERDKMVSKTYDLQLGGFYELYKQVVADKVFKNLAYPAIEEMKQGILLYENYVSDNNEIKRAIATMIGAGYNRQQVVSEIMSKYPQHGIGDYNINLLYQQVTQTQ